MTEDLHSSKPARPLTSLMVRHQAHRIFKVTAALHDLKIQDLADEAAEYIAKKYSVQVELPPSGDDTSETLLS